MSRLETRLQRLERRLGGPCARCKKRPAAIQALGPDQEPLLPTPEIVACPDCGHTPELVTIKFAFNLFESEPR